MSIYVGGTEITDIKLGSTEINSVWVGSNQVWSRSITKTFRNRWWPGFSTIGTDEEAGFNDQWVAYYGLANDYYDFSPNTDFNKSPLQSGSGTPSISGIYWDKLNVPNVTPYEKVFFTLSGNVQNSGWTSMTIQHPGGTTTLSRASASFTAGTTSQWVWNVTSNPFGTSNQSFGNTPDTITVTWT